VVALAIPSAVISYAVADNFALRDQPAGRLLDIFVRREDAEVFVEAVRGDEPELTSYPRIERSELEAGGLN
jgi:hypothetical protein